MNDDNWLRYEAILAALHLPYNVLVIEGTIARLFVADTQTWLDDYERLNDHRPFRTVRIIPEQLEIIWHREDRRKPYRDAYNN